MRKKKTDQDQFFREVFTHMEAGQPGTDFTQRVMNRIVTEKRTAMSRYQPLISTRGWLGISAVIIVLFVVLLLISSFGTTAEESVYITYIRRVFESIDLDFITGLIRIPAIPDEMYTILYIGLSSMVFLYFLDRLLIRSVFGRNP